MEEPTSNTPDEQGVQFSPEQQAKLNELLAAERRAGDERAEQVRKAGAARIAQLSNKTDADKFLQDRITKSDLDAQAKAELDKLFADAAACNKMCKEDPALYKQLKERYQQLGGLGGVPPAAPKTGGSKAFGPM